MPVISSFYGIVITMLLNEHNPPHFHVKYAEYRALVTIQDGLIEGSMPRRALNMIYEWLDIHKDELMNNWEKITHGELPDKIKPLE